MFDAHRSYPGSFLPYKENFDYRVARWIWPSTSSFPHFSLDTTSTLMELLEDSRLGLSTLSHTLTWAKNNRSIELPFCRVQMQNPNIVYIVSADRWTEPNANMYFGESVQDKTYLNKQLHSVVQSSWISTWIGVILGSSVDNWPLTPNEKKPVCLFSFLNYIQ